MKRLLLFAFMAILSLYASSQVVQKGDKLLGGSLSASYREYEPIGPQYGHYSNIGLLPSYGKAVKNNLVLGTQLNLSFYHSESMDDGDRKSYQTTYGTGISIFLRKYRPVQNRFGVYFENKLSGLKSFDKYKYSYIAETYKNKTWGVAYSFNPGVYYKFSDFILGEANFGGAQAQYRKSDQSDGSYSVTLSFLQQFNLGVNFVLNRKKNSE